MLSKQERKLSTPYVNSHQMLPGTAWNLRGLKLGRVFSVAETIVELKLIGLSS
jgi:hypothetical protein